MVWSVTAGGMDHPSRTKSHPAGYLSSCHAARRIAVLDQLSSLRPHCTKYISHIRIQYSLQTSLNPFLLGGGGGEYNSLVEMTVNSKEEISEEFCPNFRPRIRTLGSEVKMMTLSSVRYPNIVPTKQRVYDNICS
jgi:hypothetical protein